MVRELERNLPPDSLHEPEIECIGKGKEHRKYEFGNKVSIMRNGKGVIVGALSFRNDYDGHTLPEAIKQSERLTGLIPELIVGDRGYRGLNQVGQARVMIPGKPSRGQSRYERLKRRKVFRKLTEIELVIDHLKSDHRLSHNFFKGITGDAVNIMLAAAFNFRSERRRESSKPF